MKKSFFNMELIILSAVIEKDCYGYEIASTISKKSEGILEIKEGALYPILSRLKEGGFVSSYEKTINKKIRVYYHIEEPGILLYCHLKEEFYKKFEAVDKILKRIDKSEC